MLSDLAVPAIFGLDFLRSFEWTIDFTRVDWSFAEDPLIRYPFVDENGQENLCCGISELDR